MQQKLKYYREKLKKDFASPVHRRAEIAAEYDRANKSLDSIMEVRYLEPKNAKVLMFQDLEGRTRSSSKYRWDGGRSRSSSAYRHRTTVSRAEYEAGRYLEEDVEALLQSAQSIIDDEERSNGLSFERLKIIVRNVGYGRQAGKCIGAFGNAEGGVETDKTTAAGITAAFG